MVKACDEKPVRLFVVKQNRRNATLQLLKSAVDKKRFGRIGLIDQSTFQLDYARAEAKLRAATDNCRAAFTRHYDAASRNADSIQVHADYRLAACWAVD